MRSWENGVACELKWAHCNLKFTPRNACGQPQKNPLHPSTSTDIEIICCDVEIFKLTSSAQFIYREVYVTHYNLSNNDKHEEVRMKTAACMLPLQSNCWSRTE